MKFFFSSLLFLIIPAAFSQDLGRVGLTSISYKNNWETNGLKGKVKTIKEVNYKQSIPNSQLWYYVTAEDYWFDAKGNLIRLYTRLENLSFHDDIKYEYDQKGNNIKETSHDESGKMRYFRTNVFNAAGKITSTTFFKNATVVQTKEVYKYLIDTPLEKIYEDVYEIPKGAMQNKYREKFDKNGNMISRGDLATMTSTTISSKKTWKYDDKNNLIEEDESGYWKDTDKVIRKTTWEYDKLNRCIKEVYWNSDTTYDGSSVITKKYDDHGSVIECIYSTTKGGIDQKKSCRTEYTYDKTGNWISRKRFKLNGDPKSSLERVIEYYSKNETTGF